MGNDDRNASSLAWADQPEAQELRTARKAEAFAKGQAQVLAGIVSDAPLEEILGMLIRAIEARRAGLLCLAAPLDPAAARVRGVVGPSLPAAYLDSLEGSVAGAGSGCCGMAMIENRLVIAEDILADPRWEGYRAVAEAHGIRSCWSMPIRSRGGAVIGAFGMYCRQVRGPEPEELADLETAVNLAAIAIERRRIEAGIRESEARYRSLYSNAPVMMHSFDRAGRILCATRRCLDDLGYREDEVLGRRTTDFLTRESRRCVRRELLPALYRVGSLSDVALQAVRKDGSVIDVLASAAVERDEQGRFLSCMAVFHDVTRSKRVEAALIASEERFRNLVENISEVFFTTDREGNLTYASQALEGLTGYPVHEAMGKNLLTLALPHDIPLFAESFARRLDGTLETMEHRIRTRSSQVRWVRTSSRPMLNRGRAAGIRGVMVDITYRKQVEEQLRQSQKMEAIGRLAGGVAHDFNNLLTAINGYSSLALSMTEPDLPLHGYLSEILKSGERAAALTRQLLAYSRKQILAPRVLDLNEVVTDMQGMFRRLIGEDVELIASLASDLRAVRVDRGQVEQILLNLVVNARDAMPRGGRITVETANAAPEGPPPGSIAGGRSPAPGPYVRLSVRDDGQGMSPEIKARLFEPFFTTKPVGKGTGLGLPVVYGIVEQSEGYLTVDSEPGRGTTFSIYLPEAVPKAGEGEAGAGGGRAPGAPPGNESILIVEDEGSVRRFVRRALESLGYRVATARNGLEALHILEEPGRRAQLVIADVVMPEMGGEELAAEVRRLRPDLPVLFMSGYHEAGESRMAATGREFFLQKPFTPEALAAKVRQALDLAAARSRR